MKENDAALALVRDHLRRERADDAALEAIARGEASDESATLERHATSDQEIAASRPLGPDVEQAIAARIAPARPSAKKRASSMAGRITPLVGGLALAAAVVLYVAAGRPTELPHALLPDYALAASSEQSMRGAPEKAGAVLHLHGRPDAPFEIIARPTSAAGTRVVAYLFAIGEGEPNPVDASVEIAPGGAIRIRGEARALAGARELRLVIGGANDAIARYDDALSRARDGKSDARVRVLAVSIVRRRDVPSRVPFRRRHRSARP